MTSTTNHFCKVCLNYNEAMWCQEVLLSLRLIILNIMIIFGPKTMTFIREVQGNYSHIAKSLAMILDKWENTSIPTAISFYYDKSDTACSVVKPQLVELMNIMQRFNSMIISRDITRIMRSSEFIHNSPMMNSVATAITAQTVYFQDIADDMLPYLNMINCLQYKADRHIRKMINGANQLDLQAYEWLPHAIQREIEFHT